MLQDLGSDWLLEMILQIKFKKSHTNQRVKRGGKKFIQKQWIKRKKNSKINFEFLLAKCKEYSGQIFQTYLESFELEIFSAITVCNRYF